MNFSDTFLYQKLTYSACSLDHYLFNLNAFHGSMQKGNTCKTFAHSWLLGHFMSFYRHFRVYSISKIDSVSKKNQSLQNTLSYRIAVVDGISMVV